jgi:hypothetical protein
MNLSYQLLLDTILPDWRSRTSMEIIGSLLDEIQRLKQGGLNENESVEGRPK